MQDFNRKISIKNFFTCILITLIGLIFIISLIVMIIDPYNISRERFHPKFFGMKLEVPDSSQIGTAILSSALYKPDILILGSSRVRRGFNEVFASKLYNSKVQVTGINTLHLTTAKNIFFSISKNTKIKKIYIEVNYFMTNDCGKSNNITFDENYIIKPFSYFTLKKSIIFSLKTLRINILGPRGIDSYYDNQGQFHDLPSKVTSQENSATYKSYQNNFFLNISKSCQLNTKNQEDINELKDIFKFAKLNNVEVILLILPASQRSLDRVRQAGFTPTIENWKKNLSDLAQQFHARLIDYEDQNAFLEQEKKEVNKMPLFWDENHFSNRIGNYLLIDMHKSGHAQ